MHVTARRLVGEERGTTLVELMVGIMMASVVLIAMTILVIVTMRASARDSARVSATQVSRNGLATIVQELHSACLFPRIAPIQVGSTGTSLKFVHSTGSEATPKPIFSVIEFSGESVTQTDYSSIGSAAPPWTFSTTPSSSRLLMDGVRLLPGKSSIFFYYSASEGKISETAQSPPLDSTETASTVQVSVALRAAASRDRRTADERVPTHIQDSALLRLTAPTFNETVSPPCE